MKIYATIVTILLAAVLVIGGLTIFKQVGDQKSLEGSLRKERTQKEDAERRFKDLEGGIVAIKVTSQALAAVVDAPIIPGDVKIDRIEDASATDARQKLGDISDPKDKEQTLKEWDTLRGSNRVVDYQSILQTLSRNISRNLEPKK